MEQSHSALIIDHSSSARKILASVIRQNFKMNDVYTVSSAREATGVLRQVDKIDWIFCDNKLTDKDTFEFLGESREIRSTTDSKVILLSSDGGKEALMKAASHGVSDIILKPFTPKVIVEKVKKLVDRKSQRANKRVALFEAFEAHIAFGSAKYKSALIDISLGGCMAKTPLFNNGGMIYDDAVITIPLEKQSIKLNAELVRLERDNSSEAKILLAAFVFNNMPEKSANVLSNFLKTMKITSRKKTR